MGTSVRRICGEATRHALRSDLEYLNRQGLLESYDRELRAISGYVSPDTSVRMLQKPYLSILGTSSVNLSAPHEILARRRDTVLLSKQVDYLIWSHVKSPRMRRSSNGSLC